MTNTNRPRHVYEYPHCDKCNSFGLYQGEVCECRKPKPMTNETNEQKPQEWTWEEIATGQANVWRPDGSGFALVNHPTQAKEICDRFNELDRLRSSMGKVPERWEYSTFDGSFTKDENGYWMKASEVAPVITGYAAREYILKCTSVVQKQTIALLRSELKQAKELMQEFVDRVDKGEIRSKYTYAKFTALLTPKKEEK